MKQYTCSSPYSCTCFCCHTFNFCPCSKSHSAVFLLLALGNQWSFKDCGPPPYLLLLVYLFKFFSFLPLFISLCKFKFSSPVGDFSGFLLWLSSFWWKLVANVFGFPLCLELPGILNSFPSPLLAINDLVNFLLLLPLFYLFLLCPAKVKVVNESCLCLAT